MSATEPTVERSVRLRKPHTTILPIIAMSREVIYVESTGELWGRDELADVLSNHPPALIACQNPEAVLGDAQKAFGDEPQWQFKITPLEREAKFADGVTLKKIEMLVNFFGWQRKNGHGSNRYFYPVCPSQFCRLYIHELYGWDKPVHESLYEWARAITAFCREHDLKPTPTGGGIAAQLLRHPNFYSGPRRKVPRATNEKARPHLPGNYYELNMERSKMARKGGLTYEPINAAFYVDQTDAHHSAASAVALPDSDTLRARGRFRQLDARCWVRRDSAAWDSLGTGLLHIKLDAPTPTKPFLPLPLRESGERDVFVFSSEIAELESLGARIRWASAAWTSEGTDEAIPKFAKWAREQIAAHPTETKWLKPTLLAFYGILAAKPKHMEFIYYRAKKGEPTEVYLGPGLIHALKLRTTKEIQSPIANVIQRGMIEAETRNRSLRLARELSAYGLRVLAIYADAVIVKDNGRPLPLSVNEFPWRVKDRLTALQFLNETAFKSREKTRLPGIARKHRANGGEKNGHVRQGAESHGSGIR